MDNAMPFGATNLCRENKVKPLNPMKQNNRINRSPGFRLARAAALSALLLGGASVMCLQAGFVANPSFESNFNDTWPHYGAIEGWAGGNGVNEVAGPFHNSQTAIPDQARVAFKQGAGTLGQDIANLTPGQQYWVQFYYDARSGSQKVDITVSFNGIDIGKVANVQPAYTKNSPFYFASFPFTPDVDAGQLLFTVAVTGDSTALFDAVSIVPRDTGNVPMANPSFEASGDTPNDGILTGGLAGWTATGRYGVNKTDGTGIYANNGTAPEQDHVAVLNDVSSISQTVNGITPGKPYQLSFAYNASTGNTPHMQVKAGDTVIYEENVTAVGGAKAYRTKTVTFTATDFSALITFAQTTAGDQTLLLDDVKLVGEAAQPLPPLSITPSVAEISPGQKLTVSVAVPDLLLMTRNINITLKSMTPSVARLTGADSDGIVSLHYTKGGSSSQPLEIVGVARGSALLDVVSNDGLTISDTLMTYVVTSFIKNPSFDSAAAPAGIGAGDILGWTGGSGVNAAGQPFLDNGLVPDRKQVGYLQGAKTLSQQISGLTPGANYWLQFYYNAREFGTGWKLNLSVKFAGQEIAQIADIKAVGADMPFSFKNVSFKPAGDAGLLEFATTVEGDATLLLDAISIVDRDPSDLVVMNPSFEASGTIVGGVGYLTGNPLAGWTFAASGYGINVLGRDPFADNGVNPDQDSVAFIQNAGSMSQTLTGLTAGKKYTALMWVDPRNCCGGAIETTLRVSFDDTIVLEELIQPVLGSNPYLVKQAVFTAAGTEGILKIEHAPEAGTDRSLVIDNVRVVPEGQIPPIILTEPQNASNLLKGDSATLSVSAMGKEPLTYQWQLNGKDLAGKTGTTLDLTSLTVDQSGQYAVVVKNSVGQKTSRLASVQVYEKVAGGFDSGVAANGTLADPGTVDPHFALVVNPNDANSTKAYVLSYPMDGWVANTETSQWLAPVADPMAEPMPAVGFYTYRLTFDLTGYDPANTFITGNTAAFEGLHDIYLNGVLAPGNRRAGASASFAPFTLTSGFKAGQNTLDLMVFNTSTPKPTGIQVQGVKIGAKTAVAATSLAISLKSGQVKLSWPSSATGYILQSSPAATGTYGNDATPTVVEGSNLTVTVSPEGAAKFYRLAKP
jgi:hypothetical protein